MLLSFRHRCGWGDFGAPDPVDVAEEARWLAEPAVAAACSVPWRGGAGKGLIVSPAGSNEEHARLIREWLGSVTTARPVLVPNRLRPLFGSARALAVPMRASGAPCGVLALPLQPGWGPVARELEGLGNEFALRFESADKRAQVALLRTASVGRRPAGRRDWARIVARTPDRALGSGAPPRGRAWKADPDARRAESAALALGRDGALALGRR
jgi:hypothetical protein